MIDPALMRAMLNAGCTADQIVAVAEDAARALEEKKAEKKAKNAERQRRFRNARSALHGVTNAGNALPVSPKKETSPTPPKEKTTPSKSEAKASSGCDEKFADFWLAYPRREGPNPRKPAKLVFDRLVAKGADPERLIAAAQALAVEHPTPTRFVPHAKTWLNEERFGDVEPVIAGDTFCPEELQSTRLHVIRFRNEHDGHDPPRAVQGGKAGYLIPATWVKSMQMRQANG